MNAWLNYPTARHNNAAGFSFADGHAEDFRWLGGLLLKLNAERPIPTPPITATAGPDLNDLRKVQASLAIPN